MATWWDDLQVAAMAALASVACEWYATNPDISTSVWCLFHLLAAVHGYMAWFVATLSWRVGR